MRLVREHINESIKHLTPRLEKEIRDNIKSLSCKDKRQSLINACASGDIKLVKLLLTNGADARDINLNWCEDNIIPLIQEYRKKYKRNKKILPYTFVHVYDTTNESIKHLKPRSEEEIKSYLKNLSPKEKLETGAREGLLWLVKDALDAGADVHPGDDYALRYASGNGHLEVVKVLLDAGANVHADNDCALRYASENGHTEIVKVLLQMGADVHANNDWALRWASWNRHTEVVKLLKQYGARKKVNESIKHLKPKSEEEIHNSLRNLTILQKFQEACEHGFVWLFKEVMKEEEININTEIGVYASMISDIFYYGHIELAKYLIEEHNLNIHKDHEGPLRWAIWNFQNYLDIDFLLKERKIKLAEYLLKLGADIGKAYDHANDNDYWEQLNSMGHFMKLKNIKKII